MKHFPLSLAAVLLVAVLFASAVPVQAQHSGICTMDCASQDIRPSGYTPQRGQVPITRGKPPQQRGKGSPKTPAASVGQAAALVGSSSYTYTVPIRFAAPGRGPDPSLTLYYNSHIWFPDAVGGMMLGWERDVPSLGMALNFGFLEWNPSADGPAGILTTPDGAKHPLSTDVMNLVPKPGPPPNNLWYECANQICLYDSDDSTYIHVSRPLGTFDGSVCQGPNNCPAKDSTVTYKNGTVAIYQSFAVVTNDIFDEFVMRPYHIQDANGNYINITYANASDLSISSITDSLGRTTNFFYNGSQLSCVTDGASCNAPGSRTYNFNWTNLTVNFNFSTSAQLLSGGNLSNITSGFTLPVVSSVCRPDATCVKFNYGDWGIVNDIQELSANGTVRYELSYDFPAASAGALPSNPSYTHQIEKINGQTNTWTYAVNTDPTTGVITSTAITDPLNTTTTTTYSRNGDWADGLPTQVQVVAEPPPACPTCVTPAPVVMRTQNLVWTSDLSEAQSGITNGGTQTGVNPRPASITTILDDNSQSQVTLQYDNSTRPAAAGASTPFTGSGSITDKIETDFGANALGPVIRETLIQYTQMSNHILGLPTDVQVKNGAGKVISHTVMSYDGGTLQSVSPLPAGHDNVNYSATSTVPRGNLTSSTSYADPVGNTGGVTTTFTFNMMGNKVAEKVGCCKQTAWNYSSTTQYAYPDSMTVGPSGNQLTTSYTYDFPTGELLSKTDANNQKTTFTYDVTGRSTSTTTPDGVTVRQTYDDNSANPAVSTSSSANSLVTVHTADFHGHPISDQVLNGTSVVGTTAYGEDGLGRTTQVSNPFGPSDTPVYTIYAYDALGRIVQTTPPAASQGVGQNPYTIVYSGPTKLTTDPAGQQMKQYSNSLGQLVRVDVPGPSGGAFASAQVVLTGTEKSVPSNSSQNGATAGTANITVSGSERSTQVLTHPATQATGSVTINGSEQSVQNCPNTCQPPMPCCIQKPWWRFSESLAPAVAVQQCFTVYDHGTVSITVGGFTATANYTSASTPASIAIDLRNALNASNSPVTASASGSVVYITSKGTGSTQNLTLGSSSATGDTADFGVASFSGQPSGSSLTGGTNNGFTTMYDTGTLKVSFVVPGIAPSPDILVSETVAYGQTDTPTTLAQAMANKFSTDSNATPYVTASASSGQLSLVTTATGSGTNYAITLQSVTNSQNFSAGSTSFPLSGPAAFSPGQSGTLFDAGTITATLSGFNSGTAPVETVNYSQGSTASALAASMVAKINGDPKVAGALMASVPSGSSTITLTALDAGTVGNRYSINIAGTSNFPSSFPTPSFASPTVSAQLSGGADPSLSLSTPTTTTYNYDSYGHTLQVKVGQQTQTYVYDGLGRMTSAVVPETSGNAVQYSYTDFGAVSKKTDPRMVPGTSTPITTTYSYDSLNRVSSIAYNDNVTPNLTYTYNPPNSANNTGARLASISNSVETKAYQYDLMGRPTQCLETIGANQYTVKYAYGTDGQISSITYPSGLKLTYAYDPIGRLLQLSTPTQTIMSMSSSGYTAAGLPLALTYGNGVTGSFSYNNQLQVTSIQYGKAAPASPLLSLSYLYGGASNNGQIQSITDNVDSTRSTSYQYDPLGRLHVAGTVNLTSSNSWQLTFTDDIYNNRLAEAPTGGAGTMPSSYVVLDPTTNRIQAGGAMYDAVGNMVSDGLSNYVFDANNRLASSTPVPGWGGTASTFNYGPDGNLVKKNGTLYIYSGGQPIADYANGAVASSPSVEYVNVGGQQVASIVSGVITFNYSDHLSIRAKADVSGNLVSARGHFPAGEQWYQSGTTSDFQFTTYRRDTNTSLDYANARFYSSRLGRFMSPDPLLGGGYVYASSDPINLVDPTGLEAGTPCTVNPFDHRILPLCGPDQLGGAVGGSGSNCGITFGDSLSFDVTFTSNCNGFTVNFNDSRSSGPFGSYSETLHQTLLAILPLWYTCPPGGWECPEDGTPVFEQPHCDASCIMDAQAVMRAGDPDGKNKLCKYQANLAAWDEALPLHPLAGSNLYVHYLDYQPQLVNNPTPLNSAARRTGGAMSGAGQVSKWSGFWSETGKALREVGRIVTFLSVMDRREQAYQNCRNYLDGTSGQWYYHTADGKDWRH